MERAIDGSRQLGMRSFTHKLPDHTYIPPSPNQIDGHRETLLRAGEVQMIADQVVKAIKNKK